MRILFDRSSLHAWLPIGFFTLHPDESVSWSTPVDPVHEFTHGYNDDEARLPPSLEPLREKLAAKHGEVLDAVLVAGDPTRVAIAVTDDDELYENPRVLVVDVETGATQLEVSLTYDAPRASSFRDEERWSTETTFEAYGTRSIRLHAQPGGIVVTAQCSGHVAWVDLESGAIGPCWRVPADDQNTLYGSRLDGAMLIGLKFNYRHSEIYVVADDGELLGSWPPAGEVRWGMPTPIVLGDHVLTYSDEGPHRKMLHLLTLPALEEVDHAETPWPIDATFDPIDGRFAVASTQEIFIGAVVDGRIVGERHGVQELLKRSDAVMPDRPTTATVSGAGRRIWLDDGAELVAVVGDQFILVDSDGAISARTESGPPRTLLEPRPPAPSIWGGDQLFAPIPALLHADDSRILFQENGSLYILDIASGDCRPIEVSEDSHFQSAVFLGDDVLVMLLGKQRDPQTSHELLFFDLVAPDGTTTRVAQCNRTSFEQRPFLTSDTRTAAWVEYHEHDDGHPFRTIARVAAGEQNVSRRQITREIKALAMNHQLFAVTRGGSQAEEGYYTHLLQRIDCDGNLHRLSEPLGPQGDLAVAADAAFLLVGPAMSNDGRIPSNILRVDLNDGTVRPFAEATFAELSRLMVSDDTVYWFEGLSAAQRTSNAIVDMSPPVASDASSICIAPVGAG